MTARQVKFSRGDELDVLELALRLVADGLGNLRVGFGEGGVRGELRGTGGGGGGGRVAHGF